MVNDVALLSLDLMEVYGLCGMFICQEASLLYRSVFFFLSSLSGLQKYRGTLRVCVLYCPLVCLGDIYLQKNKYCNCGTHLKRLI